MTGAKARTRSPWDPHTANQQVQRACPSAHDEPISGRKTLPPAAAWSKQRRQAAARGLSLSSQHTLALRVCAHCRLALAFSRHFSLSLSLERKEGHVLSFFSSRILFFFSLYLVAPLYTSRKPPAGQWLGGKRDEWKPSRVVFFACIEYNKGEPDLNPVCCSFPPFFCPARQIAAESETEPINQISYTDLLGSNRQSSVNSPLQRPLWHSPRVVRLPSSPAALARSSATARVL